MGEKTLTSLATVPDHVQKGSTRPSRDREETPGLGGKTVALTQYCGANLVIVSAATRIVARAAVFLLSIYVPHSIAIISVIASYSGRADQ